MANPGNINASNFFGEDKVEQYREELVAQGKIPGTRENATSEERREGFKLYRKNKIEFRTFVENVLKRKASAGIQTKGTKALLSSGKQSSGIVKYLKPTDPKDIGDKSTSQKEIPKKQVEKGFDDILDRIDALLKEVKDTTKFEKTIVDKERRETEKEKRQEKESRLEGLKKLIEGPVQKILAPVTSFFQKIIDALGQILFAKVGIKLIEWYAQPENSKKVNTIIKFFRKHWLLIIGGMLLFGTKLNGVAMFLLKIGLKFIPQLVMLTGKLLFAAGQLAIKLAKRGFKMLPKFKPKLKASEGGLVLGMQGGGFLDTLGGLGVPGTGTVMAPRTSGPADVKGNRQTDPGFQSKFLGIPLGSPTSGASSRFGMTAPRGPGGDVGGYTKEQKQRYSSRTGSSFVPTSYAGSISGVGGDSQLRFPGFPSLQNKKTEIPDYMMRSQTSVSGSPKKPNLIEKSQDTASRMSAISREKIRQANEISPGSATEITYGQSQRMLGSQLGYSNRSDQIKKLKEQGLLPKQGFSGGAKVPGGFGGGDKVPALLEPGEFVVSKGAVQKYGADTFAAMNSMGGGTNRPKILEGTLRAAGGGQVPQKGKQIYLHWAATPYTYKSGPYHSTIQGDGSIYRHAPYDTRTGHTEGRNTNSVGLSVAAMSGAGEDNFGRYPVKPIQIDNIAKEAANIAKSWGWKPSDINIRSVMTHAEAGSNKDGRAMTDNYGPAGWGGTGERWDFYKARQSDSPGTGGDILRQKIKQFMGQPNAQIIPEAGGPAAPAGGGGLSPEVPPGSGAAGMQSTQEINPFEYMKEISTLYKEIYGTSPSDMQGKTSLLGVPVAGSKAQLQGGISNDIPVIGSTDPHNKSLIGMKSMHNIVG